MFFFLSKALWFFAQPLNFSLFLLIIAAFALWRGRRKLSYLSGLTAVFILIICSWTNIGSVLLQPLEQRYPRPDLPANIAGIIVLGGGMDGRVNETRGGYELKDGGDRFVEAAVLAHRFPDAKLVISGGSGALVTADVGDAETATQLFEGLGIARERLILEGKSRNTHENAVFTKGMVTPAEGETWVLITSAFHMPRSVGLFEKAGFNVTPWPVDYRTTGNESLGVFTSYSLDALETATLAMREWIGLIAYRLTGRIDSVLP